YTDNSGRYTIRDVPVGNGVVDFGGQYLTEHYCAPASALYAGGTPNATVPVDLVLTCTGLLAIRLRDSRTDSVYRSFAFVRIATLGPSGATNVASAQWPGSVISFGP